MGVTQTNSDAAEGCVETAPSRASVLKQALKKKKDRRGWKEMGKTGSRNPPLSWGFQSVTPTSHLFPKWIAHEPHTDSQIG